MNTLSPAVSSIRMKQLALLLSLATHGSLRRAADDVSLSQPAASKSLKELELGLGAELFERSHSGLKPTSAGEIVIRHADSIVSIMQRMKSDLEHVLSNQKVILRTGMIMGAVTGTFRDMIQKTLMHADDIIVEAYEGTSADLMEQLKSGQLDLVFARSNVDFDSNEIQCRPLGDEPICIVAGADHHLQAGVIYGCEVLVKYPWISYGLDSPMSVLLERMVEGETGKSPDIRLRTTSSLVTVSALHNTDCLAMLPSTVYKQLSSSEKIKKIKTTLNLSLGEYSAYWDCHSPRLNSIKKILKYVQSDGSCTPMLASQY